MFEDKTGQNVPQTNFPVHNNFEWQEWNSDKLFANKTVVLFSLPGAYTPTCSSSHLPRYDQLASAFKENGVDEIYCISVNDTFVMSAWANDLQIKNVTLLPDGNGEFTNGMGLLVEKKELGFGKRSWRYSMLVKNCVIEKMFIEEEKPGDPFGVSDADTMLNFINPEAKAPVSITILSKSSCPFCKKTKEMLDAKGMAYEEILIGEAATHISTRALSGSAGVPQIFIDGKLIGGSSELQKYLK
ncbi:MAG: glutathione peroxidase [Alcanivoracaceae bacterium]|nr:glutathione peroxidase [Alcanivoracaceae bacterium]